MATREAACHCGQLRLEVTGEPFAVSICHCLACQRRTGSAFGMQAGFKVVVSVGSFADPSFPPPTESGYDSRRHHWVGLPDSIRRFAPEVWDSVRPLYDVGRYAEAADRGRELIETYPDQGALYYNVACCESLAGRTTDAIEHLRQVIDMWDGCRDMAKGDSDFDPIRDEPAFQALIGR